MGLSYAATGLPTGADAVEKFLFDGKKGHCELFAVSFASALRLAGLPARLVGGYYGGDYNDMAGYYVITEERAHVWVEVWIRGKRLGQRLIRAVLPSISKRVFPKRHSGF